MYPSESVDFRCLKILAPRESILVDERNILRFGNDDFAFDAYCFICVIYLFICAFYMISYHGSDLVLIGGSQEAPSPGSDSSVAYCWFKIRAVRKKVTRSHTWTKNSSPPISTVAHDGRSEDILEALRSQVTSIHLEGGGGGASGSWALRTAHVIDSSYPCRLISVRDWTPLVKSKLASSRALVLGSLSDRSQIAGAISPPPLSMQYC